MSDNSLTVFRYFAAGSGSGSAAASRTFPPASTVRNASQALNVSTACGEMMLTWTFVTALLLISALKYPRLVVGD